MRRNHNRSKIEHDKIQERIRGVHRVFYRMIQDSNDIAR
jgi:hypothetical protein